MIRTHLMSHKKKYIIGASILLFVLLCAYAYFSISAQLHFTLKTELLITHEPTQDFVSTTNNNSVVVSIKTNVNTYLACNIVCDYSVQNIYELDNQTSKQLTHNITLTTPEYGFGEQLYTFKSSCRTIPSTFCPSSNKLINQTTLIVINYSLTKSELNVVTQVPAIEQTLSNASEMLAQINYSRQLLALWPANIVILDNSEVIAKQQKLLNLWRAQHYEEANDAWFSLNNSLSQINSDDVLLEQINQYNQLEQTVFDFFGNSTIKEFANYAESYDPDVRTVRQAISRLVTINHETIIDDLSRANNIATGAMDYLTRGADNYLANRTAAQTQINLAQLKLQFVKSNIDLATAISTNSSIFSTDICNATNALRLHNLWAINSGLEILNDSELQTTTQQINATYIFSLPNNFCVAQNETIDTQWPINLTNSKIIIPARENVTIVPQLNQATTACLIGTGSSSKLCPPKQSPIIFIHGHSFDASNSPQISMQAFSTIQQKLESDGFVNAGELTLESTPNEAAINAPFTVRASYYYITTYGIGDYSFAVQKSERIENYAIRLKDIIDEVKRQSGSPNVTIVAHSMGGLVVIEYVSLFGMDSIDHVITINAPHQGIVGHVASVCGLLGSAKECEDMTANSTFLQRLPPISGNWDVIASTGCQMKEGLGDGVVLQNNSILPGASNYYLLNGTCTDALNSNLHTQMLEENQLFVLLEKLLLKK